MNQILIVKKHKKNYKYKIQLYISLSIIIIFSILFIINNFSNQNKENESDILLKDYTVSRLYNTSSEDLNEIIGIIEIPKIDISYPIFSHLTDDLLKISPCRINGYMPNFTSNLCIAGHNYDNGKFFSNLKNLKLTDEIYIYDNSMKKFIYKISNIYEVEETDLSPISQDTHDVSILTLITCNNLNKKRLIIKSNLIENQKDGY